MTKSKKGQGEPTVIKKYANRRLYDTGRSSYVTLDDLCEMVKDGYDFVVYDAKSGTDITRSVLTQIIVDQESKGSNMLPVGFLKNLIGFYGDNIQTIVPNYLEQTLEAFVGNQEQIREQINKSFEDMQSMQQGMFTQVPGVPNVMDLEEISRKNFEMFESAMKMWAPFNMTFDESEAGSEKKD